MQEKLLQFINDKLDALINNNPQVNDFKRQAKVLHKKLKEEYQSKNKKDFIPLRQCQDLVAQQHGYKHWHEFHTIIKKLYQNKEEALSIKYAYTQPPQFAFDIEPIHIGYNQQLGMQAWLDQAALKKHIFLEGSEEKSKLELKLIEASIKNNDHIIYMGSNVVQINDIKELAIKVGREKDIRTISFMTDYKNYEETNWYFPKNLPFSSGALAEMIVSLIDEYTMSNRMWKGYAISLISSVVMALVYLRDQGEIVLSFDMMTEYFSLDKIIQLSHKRELPNHIIKALSTYLLSLSSSNKLQKYSFIESHGYMQMIITQILGRLNDSFSYLTKGAENKEEAQHRFDQLSGTNENLIFLITYPDFNKAPDQLSSISYMLINMIMSGFINKLASRLDTNTLNDKKLIKTTWIIKDSPLPKGFKIITNQAIAAKLQLILSYNNFLCFNETITILDSINIKCSNFKLVDNKLHYKIVVDNKEENLIL